VLLPVGWDDSAAEPAGALDAKELQPTFDRMRRAKQRGIAIEHSEVVDRTFRQPAPRGVSPGNCEALRSDNGATGAAVCAGGACAKA
jgi:hypothetical protein